MKNRIILTEGALYGIISESVKRVLSEAGGTVTSKVIASQDAPRRSFNAEEVLQRALSCNTLDEIYRDHNLFQMLRYHKMSDGRSYLDYVKDRFAKEGKYRTNKRGVSNRKRIKWTPESAIEYSSNYLNGYDLASTSEGRSCYYFLKTRGLLDKAFKKARNADAKRASKMLSDREEKLSKQRSDQLAAAEKKKADMEAKRQQKLADKENLKRQKEIDQEIARDNKIQARIEAKNRHDAERLSKSATPPYLKRYYPGLYKRLMSSGEVTKHYPGWQQVNGVWRKIG